MSDTLRTDDAQFEAYAGAFRRVVVSADFARQLERELAEARREIEVWSRRYADLEAQYLELGHSIIERESGIRTFESETHSPPHTSDTDPQR